MSQPTASGDAFVVSAHALDRFEERFPTLWTNDRDVARLIHGECHDAVEEGRVSHVAPLELANTDRTRWRPGKGIFAWTPMKSRGYVLTNTPEGTLVVTVLKGRSLAAATQSSRRRENRPRTQAGRRVPSNARP